MPKTKIMMRDHILFIDDERFFAKKYARELEKKYELTLVNSASEGLAALQTDNKISVLILDIQMPTPKDVDIYDTRNGIDTGIWLLKKYRSELIDKGMPIVILTNRKEKDIENLIKRMRYPVRQILIFHKPFIAFAEFARKITNILQIHART
jgi:CheY-like chemotaxis protein